jgi:plasmid maintenance system antidote protein VapI
MTTTTPLTMTETLRQAIAESGLPMLTIANECGVERTSLLRFARGDQSLRLDCADRLAAYFGLRLVAESHSKRRDLK